MHVYFTLCYVSVSTTLGNKIFLGGWGIVYGERGMLHHGRFTYTYGISLPNSSLSQLEVKIFLTERCQFQSFFD